MAIDTPEKRRSTVEWGTGHGVTPNAAKDLEWRMEMGGIYSGIPTASPDGAEVTWALVGARPSLAGPRGLAG